MKSARCSRSRKLERWYVRNAPNGSMGVSFGSTVMRYRQPDEFLWTRKPWATICCRYRLIESMRQKGQVRSSCDGEYAWFRRMSAAIRSVRSERALKLFPAEWLLVGQRTVRVRSWRSVQNTSGDCAIVLKRE